MAKTKDLKINEEQLAKLQGLVKAINSGQLQIGRHETQKLMIANELFAIESNLKDFQKELEEEYGTVNINIETGVITETEDEADKKD
tara:strand:- start:67 stop:327 length:261 start_codon:yes stop_codon:yes gene_type:complete